MLPLFYTNLMLEYTFIYLYYFDINGIVNTKLNIDFLIAIAYFGA